MATVAPSPPKVGDSGSPPPLWGELDIPIIVGTGEFGMGKSLFGLTICPGPQTLVYDYEGSSLTYKSIGFEHVDMAAELLAKFPNGFTSEQRYLWWREDIVRRGKSGKYRVAVIDPASEIEDGMADHLRKNITKYGLTQAQCDRSPALFWGVMKKEWKLLLDTLRSYFDTLYMTVHLRDEFRGGAPTGKREPKGKETLFELASLFLWFEREKNRKTGEVSAVPSATILKSRLAKAVFVDDELQIVPVLPPRLEKSTPRAIREYIAKPPDYSKLSKGERLHEKELSEDERLFIQAKIAADQALAAQAEVTLAEKRANAATSQKAIATPPPDVAADYAATQAEKAKSSATETNAAAMVDPPATEPATEPPVESITDATRQQIRTLVCEIYETREEQIAASKTILEQQGVAAVAEMSEVAGMRVVAELMGLKSQVLQERAAAKLAASGTTPTVDHEPNAKPQESQEKPPLTAPATDTPSADTTPDGADLSDEPGTATKEQLAECERLAMELEWAYEKQQEYLKRAECQSFRNLSQVQLADLISKLEARVVAKKAAQAAQS